MVVFSAATAIGFFFAATFILPSASDDVLMLEPLGSAVDVPSNSDDFVFVEEYLDTIDTQIITILRECGVHFQDHCDSVLLVSAKTQLVNGNNYWTKIELCDLNHMYAHIYFHVPFGFDHDHNNTANIRPELKAIQYPRGKFGSMFGVFYEDDIHTELCPE